MPPPQAQHAARSSWGYFSLIHPKSFKTATWRFTLRALPGSCQQDSWRDRGAQEKAKIAGSFLFCYWWVGFELCAQLRVANPGCRAGSGCPQSKTGTCFPKLEHTSSHPGPGFCHFVSLSSPISSCTVTGWLCIQCK